MPAAAVPLVARKSLRRIVPVCGVHPCVGLPARVETWCVARMLVADCGAGGGSEQPHGSPAIRRLVQAATARAASIRNRIQRSVVGSRSRLRREAGEESASDRMLPPAPPIVSTASVQLVRSVPSATTTPRIGPPGPVPSVCPPVLAGTRRTRAEAALVRWARTTSLPVPPAVPVAPIREADGLRTSSDAGASPVSRPDQATPGRPMSAVSDRSAVRPPASHSTTDSQYR